MSPSIGHNAIQGAWPRLWVFEVSPRGTGQSRRRRY
jgi:hypothetical protein